jgi:hypothetical protein
MVSLPSPDIQLMNFAVTPDSRQLWHKMPSSLSVLPSPVPLYPCTLSLVTTVAGDGQDEHIIKCELFAVLTVSKAHGYMFQKAAILQHLVCVQSSDSA